MFFIMELLGTKANDVSGSNQFQSGQNGSGVEQVPSHPDPVLMSSHLKCCSL